MNEFISTLLEMSFNASILIAGVVVARFFLKKAPKYTRKVL